MLLSENTSIYLQIAKKIEDDILRDIIEAGEKVLSTNEFAGLYHINPATAAKGVNLLVERGVLFKKRGIGMFVSDGAKKIIIGQRKEQFYENYIISLVKEAKNLKISEEELMGMVEKANQESDQSGCR